MICPECEMECEGYYEDFGIGPYEFWGRKGFDSDVRFISDCCQGELPAPDIDDRGDYEYERWRQHEMDGE